ncbi:hypothetical protein V493_04756 [Pseudogymnoascus sp. VKM F-4281 (FW-2241)]|nr:hypothetical protein V493_04756 [Pseudogymnoascus sp. VKM F-4281 (FW-2241)]
MARLRWKDVFWNEKRGPFVIALVGSASMLILLFLGNLSYIYGALYRSGTRVSAINILAVDYDQGVIGESLIAAYSKLQGEGFPTLQFHSPSEYATIDDVQNAVCKGDYWAAIVAQEEASTRLADALNGGTPAKEYDASNTIMYVYNGARYAVIQDSFITANMQALIGAAGGAYNSINGTNAVSVVNTADPNAVLALLNPIMASSINITPTGQGTRVLYNTVTIILPIIQQFFFVMALNGISTQFGIYGRLHNTHTGLIRIIMSTVYTFIASLTVIGYIWAFREDWLVDGNQFALSWMVVWLYMHVNFLVLDAATAYIPMSFMPFFVLTWAIINITSTIFPFELNPGFYRWGYALPAHSVFSILLQIWSGGCNNQLKSALPVLFGWEVIGGVLAVLGFYRRNRVAERELDEEENSSNGKPMLEGSLRGSQELERRTD